MGVGSSQSLPSSTFPSALAATFFPHQSQPIFSFNPSTIIFQRPCKRAMTERSLLWSSSSSFVPLNSGKVDQVETQVGSAVRPLYDFHGIDEALLQRMVYDALVWSSLHGLVVGDRTVKRSGTVPGVCMVHAPFALLPMSFPESHWQQACELTPIFNELVDRVSLDWKFLQEALSRTKKVDSFTSRLLDIHSKMQEMNKKEEIRLGLHRSDYMLDEQTKLLLQIELNTISSSFPGLSCLVTELHRSLLNHYGKHLGLDSKRIPGNSAVTQFAEALAQAWKEYNNPRALVMFVVQTEERNMYDQHWLSTALKERYPFESFQRAPMYEALLEPQKKYICEKFRTFELKEFRQLFNNQLLQL